MDPGLIHCLGSDTFAVVPLMALNRPLGVLVADNGITLAPIPPDLVHALEIFAGHAAVAIEHSRLRQENRRKISELERITKELNSNKDRLVRSERYSAIGQMVGRLVQRIRNPITSLRGTARMLERHIQEPRWKKFLAMMATETSRLETVLDDVFNFIENGHLHLIECSLPALAQEACKQLYHDMMEQNIRYACVAPARLPTILLDDQQMIQLIVHLLQNALDAMPQGGTLKVKVYEVQGRLCLEVCDSGEGFTPEALERADEPFFHHPSPRYWHGHGLGPAHSRRPRRPPGLGKPVGKAGPG